MKQTPTLFDLGIENIHPNYTEKTPNEINFPKSFNNIKDPIEKINIIHKKMLKDMQNMNKEANEILNFNEGDEEE